MLLPPQCLLCCSPCNAITTTCPMCIVSGRHQKARHCRSGWRKWAAEIAAGKWSTGVRRRTRAKSIEATIFRHGFTSNWFIFLYLRSKLCVPSEAENKDEEGVVHCRYKTHSFAQGINHAVFLINNQTTSLCSSSQHTSQNLVQHCKHRHCGSLYWAKWSAIEMMLLFDGVTQWEHARRGICTCLRRAMETKRCCGPAHIRHLPRWTETLRMSSASGCRRRTSGLLVFKHIKSTPDYISVQLIKVLIRNSSFSVSTSNCTPHITLCTDWDCRQHKHYPSEAEAASRP